MSGPFQASRNLHRRGFLQLAGAAAAAPLASVLPSPLRAEAYPARPVRVIVSSGPGGQGDTTARLFALKLGESLGQSFYIENIGGGGGTIAMGMAARTAPDGYSLLAATGSFHQSDPLSENRLRPAEGFRSDQPALLVAPCARGQSQCRRP